MSFVFVNNVQTTLASAITSTATTITLSSSANLPTLSSGEQMPLTLLDKATKSIYEICYVTAISGSSLTVLRAQEGTTASAYNAGDYAFSGPTAGTVFPVDGQDINVVTLDVSGTATLGTADVTTLDVSGTAVVPPAAASNQAVNLGQVLNGVVPVAGYANGSGTTGAATTGSLTAPSNGMAIVIASFSSGTGSVSGTGVTASLSGLVEVLNSNGGNYFSQSVWYLPMSAGQSSTFTGNLSQTTSGAYTLTLVAFFQPNP